MRLPLLAAALLLAAGCVTPPPTSPDAPGAALDALPFPDPMGQDHDHGDAAIHAGAWRFEETFHHPLAGSATHSSGAHALDVKAGFLFAASYGGTADAEGGFFVFDLSDPLKPQEVGRYRFPGAMGGDRSMEATDDAKLVVLGTEPVDCAGHIAPAGPGLHLIDVSDKTRPLPIDYLPSTGVHSVTIHRIDGEDYVFGLMPDKNVVHIDTSGPKPRLVPVAELPIGHDSIVVDDEILGKPLLYAANGEAGFEVWDVSKPEAPEKVGAWNIPDRPKDKYYIHTGAVRFMDGKRIAVVTTEDWEDYPSQMYVLDATDLSYIETLGNWTAPGNHGAEMLRYSMHNPYFFGDSLVLAYYHGGVWRLDLSTPEARERPEVIGHFMPATSNGWKPEPPTYNSCGFDMADAPFTFDVRSGDGVVYVADLHTGLYAIRPTP